MSTAPALTSKVLQGGEKVLVDTLIFPLPPLRLLQVWLISRTQTHSLSHIIEPLLWNSPEDDDIGYHLYFLTIMTFALSLQQ